ncbi:HAD-IA family hydrolase [Algirhabdus cladophorae]|uniref:HAD-IA family hydrolase n=1 Tax=Algirhabdus cladophorae TaxID=3377108 RepID=UPI003B846558
MGDLRLVIFDVDGTLVDSQGTIVLAMNAGLKHAGLAPLSREKILSIVGLSLPEAAELLVPGGTPQQHADLAEGYRRAYRLEREAAGPTKSSPLYPGALETLTTLNGQPETLLGVATGKSKRGLDILIASYGLEKHFVTLQAADFHPSKPSPSMVLQALDEAGVDAAQAVMIGDTTYDIEMGCAAGVKTIGVAWGYHAVEDLLASGAHKIATEFAQIPSLIDELLGA